MDRIRFGRALGTGARAAAKSMLSAAEAAAAPSPPASASTPRPHSSAAGKTSDRPRMPIPDPKAIRDQTRNLKRSVWSPFAKFSTVLWLEVTGLFFGIFALVTGEQVWRWRAAVHLPPTAQPAQRLYLYAVLFALFGYFTVSSFIRARRRQRR